MCIVLFNLSNMAASHEADYILLRSSAKMQESQMVAI